jgi:hypothetical protein
MPGLAAIGAGPGAATAGAANPGAAARDGWDTAAAIIGTVTSTIRAIDVIIRRMVTRQDAEY